MTKCNPFFEKNTKNCEIFLKKKGEVFAMHRNRAIITPKILKIKNKKEYNKLLEYYLILSIDSLKVMSKTKNFKEIIKIANEKY